MTEFVIFKIKVIGCIETHCSSQNYFTGVNGIYAEDMVKRSVGKYRHCIS